LALTPVAHADMWCFDDPVVSINGRQTTVNVGVNADAATVAAAGIGATVVVSVPAGVPTSVIIPPSTRPFLETFSFVTRGTWDGSGPIPVTVKVTFSSMTKLHTLLNVTYPSGATAAINGMSNGTLATEFSA
jgi:hypothetical protein